MASLSPGGNVTTESISNMYNSDMDASKILELFSKSSSSLLNFMNNTQITDDYLSLLIHLIAKSCRDYSTDKRQNILNMLQNFAASSILASRGTRLLVGITCSNQHFHQFNCLVSDFVDIIQELHTRMPTLCHTTDIIGLLEFLEKQIPECDQLGNVEILHKNVCQLKTSILSNAQNRSKDKHSKSSKVAEDDLIPPDDFRNIPVVPQERDFFNQVTFLRRNKVFGKYLDLNHYLDVQFRLYREDCIAPLRDSLLEFLQKDEETRNFRLENGLIYRNIRVIKQSMSVDSGEVFEIALDKEHVKRINWTKSKRLIYGSLLLLSFDHFQTIFRAVVVESDRKTLQGKGCFTVQVYKSRDNHKLPKQTKGLMIEATSAYFEAYKHVLKALQTMGSSTTIFPFERYLVKCEPDILPPTYITEDSKYDVQPIIKNTVISLEEETKPKKYVINADKLTNKIYSREVKLFDEDNWPSKHELRMDKSQREAFISALTKEFVLIQGPPGTGKTYLGLQIAKALLHNTKTWRCDDQIKDGAESISENIDNIKIPPKPYMLVVCFSNHALDQFVEGIVDFMPSQSTRSSYSNVVRFGNQSKNPKIEKFSIKNIRTKVRRLFTNHRFGVLDTATATKRQIKEIRELLNGIKNRNIVLGIDLFRNVMNNIHWQNFGVDDRERAWYQWLHVTTDAWYKEVNKQYLNQGAPIEPLAEKHTSLDDEEFVTVVSDSEHAFNERYLDLDSVKTQVKIENFGLDLDQQLQKQLRKVPQPEEECLRILKHEKKNAERELHNGPCIDERKSNETKNLWKLPIEDRWKMYRFWKKKYIKHLYEQLRTQEEIFNDIFEEYTSASREMDEVIMQNAAVVAMTTTSAARYNESLSKVAPRVVIIEEAAEVPETHILTSINPKCQHIILIGDHKQLEPKPAVYKLAKEYNLSISLFERMLNNGLSYHCLQRQHRMRPEISALVRHIYPTLDDNENVLMYEHIRGIRKSVFFISHDHKEKYNDEGRSYSNDHEAEYLKGLCMYLLKQGYQRTEITILAAYSGQMFCLKEKMPKSKFEGVHICVLDNYQGEENEIILLSLVRGNDKGDIGFLNRENRICVALSRARKGLYIIGNSETLTKKSKHWQTIIQKLKGVDENCNSENVTKDKSKIAFGKALPLYCQNHPDSNGIFAKHPHDFEKVPDGGCNLACEFKLDCDHSCRYKCHPFDKEHKEYICKKQCLKLCPEGHACTKSCHFPTYCLCNVSIKRELPCKHIVNLKCHVDYLQHTCTVIVSRKLECGHTANMECNFNPQKFLCKVIMEKPLECGHSANIECQMDLKCYNCKQVIKTRRSECGHDFERQCYDTLYEQQYKCKDIITVQRSTCKHEYQRQCYDIAYEQNNPCREIITDKWPSCAHTYERYCHDKAYNTVNTCKEVVKEVRPECGHEYKRQCYDIEYVVREKCSTITTKTFPACGHQIDLPCHTEIHFQKCNKTILSNFECGHSRRHACYESTNVKCISQCLKRCKYEHTCQQPCHFPDSCNCENLVDVILDNCKHHQMIPCSADPQNFDCKEIVKKTIPVCGHQQQMECNKNPEKFKCMASVRKSLPSCEHKQIIACFADITGIKCTNPVDVILPNCGHKAKTECWKKYADISDVQCHSVVVKIRPNCGHSTNIECWQKHTNELLPCDSVIELNLKCGHVLKSACSHSTKEHECKEICGKRMPCGHPCPIVCSTCQANKQHGNCKVKCDEELLCGHPCNCTCMKCTPCQQQCEFSCMHSKCSLRCIDPCIPCHEYCTWQCPHFKCTKLCSEECNRPICNKFCDKKLTCGHLCNGFCGEPCPEFCIRCKPEMFVGMKVASEVDRIVTLPLCGHSFTRTCMDTVIKKTKNKIWPRCPSCNTVIYFHPRYNDILNRKKILFEHAKRIIRDVMFTKETVFPSFDVQFKQNVEVYAGIFATYLRIVKHLPYAKNLKELLDASQNLVREVISTIQKPFHDFNSHLVIAKQNLQMFVKWITCLSSIKPNVLNKYYTISICSSDLNINTLRRDDSLKLTDRKSMTGADILSMVCKVVDTLQIDYILHILQPLFKEIGRNAYLVKAKQFPQQLKVVGVHFNDWRVCKKEHMTSCLLNSSCDMCNSEIDLEDSAVELKKNPSIEPAQKQRTRMREQEKRKDKTSHDQKNNDLALADNIYERIPSEVLKIHSGPGKNIGSEGLLGTNKSKFSVSNKRVKANTMKDHKEDVVVLKNTSSFKLEPTQTQMTRKRGRGRRKDKTIHYQKNIDPSDADKTCQRAELAVKKKRNSTRDQRQNIESRGLLNKNKSQDKKSPDLSEKVKGNSKDEHREDVVLKHTPSKAPTDRQRTRKTGLDIRKDKTMHDPKSKDPSVSHNAYEGAELEVKKKQNSNMGLGRNVKSKGMLNENNSDDKKSSRSREKVKGNSKNEHREDVVLKHTLSKAPTDIKRTRKTGLDIRKDKTMHDQKSNDPSVSDNAYEGAELEVKKKQNSNMGREQNVESKGMLNKNNSDAKKSSRSIENVKVNKTTKRPD